MSTDAEWSGVDKRPYPKKDVLQAAAGGLGFVALVLAGPEIFAGGGLYTLYNFSYHLSRPIVGDLIDGGTLGRFYPDPIHSVPLPSYGSGAATSAAYLQSVFQNR